MSGKVRAILQELMLDAMTEGFFGEVTLQVSFQDGTIQTFTEERRRYHRPQ